MNLSLQKESETMSKADVRQLNEVIKSFKKENQGHIAKLKDIKNDAAIYLALAEYLSCVIEYRTSIENAIDIIIQHPRANNAKERYTIHKLIHEERNTRKKLLGEIATKLGELALYYIRLSKNKPGKTMAPVTSENSD